MFYRNPRRAFIFESVVGLISLVSIVTFGQTGLALICIFLFRPIFFRKGSGHPDDDALVRYSRIFRTALILTGSIFIALSGAKWSGLLDEPGWVELIFFVLPIFMTVHGLTGLFLPDEEGGGEGGRIG